MSENGIAWLATKEDRQIAKLNLAAEKRGEVYNIDLLPTKYSGNDVIDNLNVGGLQPHRPWTTNTLSTYSVKQYLYDYSGNSGNNDLYVLITDYPNASMIPVGAVATINGIQTTVSYTAPSSSPYFNGAAGRIIQFATSVGNIPNNGILITFTW